MTSILCKNYVQMASKLRQNYAKMTPLWRNKWRKKWAKNIYLFRFCFDNITWKKTKGCICLNLLVPSAILQQRQTLNLKEAKKKLKKICVNFFTTENVVHVIDWPPPIGFFVQLVVLPLFFNSKSQIHIYFYICFILPFISQRDL